MAEVSTLVDQIMDYEAGELSPADTIELFSTLIKSGNAWTLQGHYGRTARYLIEAEYIDDKGNVLRYPDE